MDITPTGGVPRYGRKSTHCTICGNLDRSLIASYLHTGKNGFFISMEPSLIKRQAENCDICSMICKAISSYVDSSALDDELSSIHIEGVNDYSKPLMIRVGRAERAALGGITPPEVALEVYILRKNLSPMPAIGISHHVAKNPNSEASYTEILTWLYLCETNHPDCRSEKVPKLPTRVIDVKSEGKSPQLHISQPEETALYATLSHCWGSKQPLKTEQDTIKSRIAGIKWLSLPKTFQEAITIVRKLGLQYLWIDSICIIQDDHEDWQRESAKMASVYADSYLTITSTGFPDSGGGLLGPRKRIQFSSGSYTVFIREYLDHEQFADDDSGEEEYTRYALRYPLFERGWCFQERVLARRVLHYTSMGIVLECRSGIKCECGCSPENRRLGSFKHVFSGFQSEKKQLEEEDDAADRFFRWSQIVENYSAKKLTYQEDVLPALSGVASQIHSPEMGKYLAGLWEKDLVHQLLWASKARLPETRRPEKYLAPSFSWASRIGAVAPFQAREGHVVMIDVLETGSTLKSPNEFGEVSSGFVKVRGLLAEAKFHSHECDECPYLFAMKLRPSYHVVKGDHVPEFFSIDAADDALEDGETVYCLLVIVDDSRAEGTESEKPLRDSSIDWSETGGTEDKADDSTETSSERLSEGENGEAGETGKDTADNDLQNVAVDATRELSPLQEEVSKETADDGVAADITELDTEQLPIQNLTIADQDEEGRDDCLKEENAVSSSSQPLQQQAEHEDADLDDLSASSSDEDVEATSAALEEIIEPEEEGDEQEAEEERGEEVEEDDDDDEEEAEEEEDNWWDYDDPMDDLRVSSNDSPIHQRSEPDEEILYMSENNSEVFSNNIVARSPISSEKSLGWTDDENMLADDMPGRDDVRRGKWKAQHSHSAVLILQSTGEPGRYKRIGAAHDFMDNFFGDAVQTEITLV